MSNQVTQAEAGTTRVTSWLHVDDFSPGIWDTSYVSPATQLGAPLGAASPTGTFCCASLQGGGLGPLPGIDFSQNYPAPKPGETTRLYTVGFADNPGLLDGNEELVLIMEGDDGINHYVVGWSTEPNTADFNVILNDSSATTPGYFGAPYPTWTRMSSQPVIGDPGYIVPEPRLVFPTAVLTDPHGNEGHLWVYPTVASPGSFGCQDLVVPGDTVSGQVIAYNSRLQVLAGVGYTWPTGGGISTNENINYNDPPESQNLLNQQTILAAEEPWGYGAWGSVSVGELVLIKKQGGGVVMNGDISEPTSVITLPGIQPTGNFVGKADASSIGLVYCSENRGAWLWNGGNTSQKISPQINDNFFDCSSSVIASNNYGFCVHHWQDWILFSNNWMYNPDTGGWWIMYPQTGGGNADVIGQTFWWWQQGRYGYQCYAAPLFVDNTLGETWYSRFNSHSAASNWSWTSLPLHVSPNANRVIDVTQVILRVSNPVASGSTITITIGEWTATTPAIGPEMEWVRLNAGNGSLGLVDMTVSIQGNNPTPGDAAPVLHSIDIGYTTRAQQASDN